MAKPCSHCIAGNIMPDKRAIVLVLDGAGAGVLPDAPEYGDEGANTLLHALQAAGSFELPFLHSAGLGNLLPGSPLPPALQPIASYGLMQEKSKGKDTIVGHWEMMGLITEVAFPTYPHGFPPEVVRQFEQAIGRKTLGNVVASGTIIIEELGPEHLRTGFPIIYTSADSVFQIACHEQVIPPAELYRFCQIARQILVGDHGVARVIARPFVGAPGSFLRTGNRKDFTIPPPGQTALDLLVAAGVFVLGLGKIIDVFSGRGINQSNHAPNNREILAATGDWLSGNSSGFCFVNLIDFDMLWGHRRKPVEFVRGLEVADRFLAATVPQLGPEDLLIVTADHGNDPTFSRHFDHTREQVPVLVFQQGRAPFSLGVRSSFADVGATVLSFFVIRSPLPGISLLPF
jgi:phosphopentomutase